MIRILATATLALGMALGSADAWAEIVVGPGFGTPCAEGGCPLFSGSVNAIGTNSLDFFQTTVGPVDTSAVTLILAVPDNPSNALAANPVSAAQLHVPGTNTASTPVAVGGISAETLMTRGDVEDTLGLLVGHIVNFTDLRSADYFLFPATYNATTNPIDNFSLYQIPLTAQPGTVFTSNDLINIDFTSLPVGTFALGYATPSLSVTDTSFAEAGVSGVLVAGVPEPTTLALLGSALFGLYGLRWFRRRRV